MNLTAECTESAEIKMEKRKLGVLCGEVRA
jgi:hypothetical protein